MERLERRERRRRRKVKSGNVAVRKEVDEGEEWRLSSWEKK